jgi:hypothetical protein
MNTGNKPAPIQQKMEIGGRNIACISKLQASVKEKKLKDEKIIEIERL